MKENKSYILNLLRGINLITSTGRFNPNKEKIFKKHPTMLDKIIKHTCFLVGDEILINERLYCILNNITIQPECSACGTILRYKNDKKEYPIYCSVKCAKNNDSIKKRTRETNIQRYGVAHPMQNNTIKNKVSNTINTFSENKKQLIQQKREATCIERYGIVHPSTLDYIKQKQENTNLTKYGFKCAASHPLIAEKIKQNHAKKLYGNINNAQYLTTENESLTLKQIATNLEISHSVVSTRFKKFNIPVKFHSSASSIHNEVVEWLKTIGVQNIKENDRDILNGKEIDILILDISVGIEIDGIYWHSEIIGGKNKNYHLNKTTNAKEKGILLIHLYDIEWMQQKQIVQSRILSKLQKTDTIYARKCNIQKINSKTANNFFNKNHLQGIANSSKQYGLYYNDELVSCMSFSKSRFNRSYEWELLRFSNKINCTIVGGASRLFMAFIKDINPKNIISYSDKRWGDGKLYQNMGFLYSHTSAPNFKYVKNGKLFNRIKFQKHKLEKLLKIFSPTLSAWENMINNNYDRIWDCGNDVWIWKST